MMNNRKTRSTDGKKTIVSMQIHAYSSSSKIYTSVGYNYTADDQIPVDGLFKIKKVGEMSSWQPA